MTKVYAAVLANYEYHPEYMHVTREGVERWLASEGYILNPDNCDRYIHRDYDTSNIWNDSDEYYIEEYDLHDDIPDRKPIIARVTLQGELIEIRDGKEYVQDTRTGLMVLRNP